MSILFLAITVAAFIAGFLAIFGVNLILTDLYAREQKLQRERLESVERERLKERAREYAQNKSLAELAVQASSENEARKSPVERLKELIDQAGLSMDPKQLLAWCTLGAVGLSVVLGLTTHNILLAALGGLGMFWIPILWVRRKRTQRLEALRGQLPDALELMSRVLRAGQTMTQAMLAVSKEFRAPVATEFALCYEQQNLGLSADVTLHELSKRTGLIELKIFVLALLVHRRAGGNLAELLEKLSGTIRERYKIRGRVKALTAEGRLQGIVLLAMPPLIFGMLHVVNRPYAMKLYDHPGLIGVSIVSMALGALLIRKIVNFDF